MDGLTIKKKVYDLLSEDMDTSRFVSDRRTFDFVYEAVCDYVETLQSFIGTQVITTVESQQEYELNPDFLSLYLRDIRGRRFAKYNDGSDDSFIYWQDYSEMILSLPSSSQAQVERFSIIDDYTITSILGTASLAGNKTNGESVLTSATSLTSVAIGDSVQNITDVSSGVVIATTPLTTCLFDGTDDEWDVSDSFAVIPQGRKKLALSPIPSEAGHTITISYIKKPVPVYSNVRGYPIPDKDMESVILKAVGSYKMRDQKLQEADYYLKLADKGIKKSAARNNRALNRETIQVSFIKRARHDGSGR